MMSLPLLLSMLFLLRAACQLQSAPARKVARQRPRNLQRTDCSLRWAVAVKPDGTSVPCLANFVSEHEPHGIASFCIWLHAVLFAARGHGSILFLP
jgi:hypothetical protein